MTARTTTLEPIEKWTEALESSRERLLAVEPKGLFREDISFSYTLARRP